jgi:hypothetical protein
MVGLVFDHQTQRRSALLLDRSQHVLATLTLCETTPDAIRLFDLQCGLKALFTDGTHFADRPRSLLSPFSFVLALERAGWEEEV